jgi:hypothetical protein
MAEGVLACEIGSSRQVGGCRSVLRVVSFCVKAAVVLFPVPAAFLTGAPPEMKLAGVYCTLVTLGLFLALAEIAGGVRRLADTVDGQRRAS